MIKKIPIKGISRNPSGQISADGFCAESLNVQLDMGEVAPVLKPTPVNGADGNPLSIDGDILFIHKGNGYENVIYRDDDELNYVATISTGGDASGTLYDDLVEGEEINDITSIGNTIVMSTSENMYYFLWKNGEYRFLGNQIPIPNIHFRMNITEPRENPADRPLPTSHAETPTLIDENGDFYYSDNPADIANLGVFFKGVGANDDGIKDVRASESILGQKARNFKITEETQRAWLDCLWGVVDDKLQDASADGKTPMPIFVRYAVRLYDGTSYAQSIPILLGSDLTRYIRIRTGVLSVLHSELDEETNVTTYSALTFIPEKEVEVPEPDATAYPDFNYLRLYVDIPDPYSIIADFDDTSVFEGWEDIVNGVDIFVSAPIKPTQRDAVELTAIQGYYAESEPEEGKPTRFLGIFEGRLDPYYTVYHQDKLLELYQTTYLAKSYSFNDFADLEGSVVLDDIDLSTDYILAQEALKETPRSMHHYTASSLFTYNKRLLLQGTEQTMYNGYPYLNSSKWVTPATPTPKYEFVYHIQGDGEDSTVIVRDVDANKGITPMKCEFVEDSGVFYEEAPVSWLAYPDSRCYRVDIYFISEGSTTTFSSYPMKPMSTIDVAYIFFGFGIPVIPTSPLAPEEPEEQPVLKMPNTLMVSLANNPFIFPVVDSITFTAGKILNLAVATKALSEGQFGQFPLYVFTDEGVFALSTTADGSFAANHPVSRDVLISKDALTGIEQGVFFAAARGLLLLQGSSVTKVSSEMEGIVERIDQNTATMLRQREELTIPRAERFFKFIDGCKLVYDYMNSRIVLFRDDDEAQYVYKFDTQSWHRMSAGIGTIVRALNSYPEAQIVTEDDGTQSVYNLSIPSESDESEAVPGVIYTRDLALDAADIYKTIFRIKVRGRYAKGHVKWQLQGSNDGMNYRNLRSLRGPSWKWYRLVIATKLSPGERISFVEMDYSPRFTNKIR